MKLAWWVASAVVSLQAYGWTVVSQGLLGWQTPTLTIRYNFDDCLMSEAALLAHVDAMIATWNVSYNTSMRLERATSASSDTITELMAQTAVTPLIVCDSTFAATQSVDANAIPALTRVSTSQGRVAYAGLVLNAQSGAGAEISQLSSGALAVTIAHEMGHALGLGHTADTDALMYYSIAGKDAAVLTRDDMEGISFLYPRSEFSGGAFGCARTAAPHQAGALGSLGVVCLLAAFVLGRIVRSERPL